MKLFSLILLILFVSCSNNNFNGLWFHEEDNTEGGKIYNPQTGFDFKYSNRLNFQIEQKSNKINGLFSYYTIEKSSLKTWDTEVYNFTGEVKDGSSFIKIYDNKFLMGDGELIKKGDSLRVKLNQIEDESGYYLPIGFKTMYLKDTITLKPEEIEIESNKVQILSLNDCVKIMENHCKGSNQQLIKYFESEIDGKKVFMFFTLSFDKPGYSCVSLMTPLGEDIIGVDCKTTKVKVMEWNNLSGSPKIYL